MSKPEVATIVMDCLKWLVENERWVLYSACIMGNHLHVVVRVLDGQEEVELGPIINSFKTCTANRANKVLGTTGLAFWAPVYYDRDVRQGKFMRVMWYVLHNPVAAGLVDSWMDWRFTYVHPEYREDDLSQEVQHCFFKPSLASSGRAQIKSPHQQSSQWGPMRRSAAVCNQY
jgi:REP element-mobilizing transposase RayT